MLSDQYLPEDMIERAPQIAEHIDLILRWPDALPGNDAVSRAVRDDVARQRTHALICGRPLSRELVLTNLHDWRTGCATRGCATSAAERACIETRVGILENPVHTRRILALSDVPQGNGEWSISGSKSTEEKSSIL